MAVSRKQGNKSPKNEQFSEEKVSGLGSFNFWNYPRGKFWLTPMAPSHGHEAFIRPQACHIN
jgi:hypothetical protein